MAINKIIFGTSTLIDLTSDTITPNDVINNRTFHMADGSVTTGTLTYDADTKDATATAAEILSGKTAYKAGNKLTGEMPNVGTTTLIISTTNGVTIPQGYHDGGGSAILDSTEQAKLIASNIKNGVSILGVLGTLTGSEMVSATTVDVTPTKNAQTVTPPVNFDYISQVNIAAIPYSETPTPGFDNALTATIAGA